MMDELLFTGEVYPFDEAGAFLRPMYFQEVCV